MTYHKIKQYLVTNGFRRGKAEYVRKMIRELCQDTVAATKVYYDHEFERGKMVGAVENMVSLFDIAKAHEYVLAADDLYRKGVLTANERLMAVNLVREKTGMRPLRPDEDSDRDRYWRALAGPGA